MSARSFFHDGLSVFITKIAVIGLSVLSVIIQARALGPDARGLLAMLLIYPQLLTSVAEGGMRQATVYYVGRKIIPDAQVFGASILYTLGSCAIFSSLIYFLLFNSGEDYTVLMMLMASAYLPLTLFMNAIRGVFLGKQQIRQFNTSQWLQKLVMVGLLAVLYLLDQLSVQATMGCILVGMLIGFMPALYHFLKTIYTSVEYDLPTLWRMIRKGAIYAAALFLIEANYKVDILLLGWMSTKEEVGLYSVAVQVGELLWQLPAAIGIVVFSRSANDQSSKAWAAELARSIRVSLWITLAGGAVLFAIAPYLFDLFFGEEFRGGVSMTLWLLPGLIIMVIFKLLNMDLAGKGRPWVSLYIMLPALILNVVLNYLFIPKWGGDGSAMASSISYVCAAIVMLITYSRMHDVSALDFVIIRPANVRLLANKISSKLSARKEA